jgi:hypothetical protein
MMPATPPATLIITASARNWAWISPWVAPIARRTPISLMRSRIEASMMFMIPIPPTTSEIDAMAPSTMLKIVFVRCSCLSSSSGTLISKSVTSLCRRWSIRRTTSATAVTSVERATCTITLSSWW